MSRTVPVRNLATTTGLQLILEATQGEDELWFLLGECHRLHLSRRNFRGSVAWLRNCSVIPRWWETGTHLSASLSGLVRTAVSLLQLLWASWTLTRSILAALEPNSARCWAPGGSPSRKAQRVKWSSEQVVALRQAGPKQTVYSFQLIWQAGDRAGRDPGFPLPFLAAISSGKTQTFPKSG